MNASTQRDPDGVEPGAEVSLTDDPWQRLCRELTACEPPYPTETVRWALEQREALTPHFLALLERVSRDPAAASEDDGHLFNWGYVYLAIWRDSRAWEPMLALLWQPAEVVEELLGDMLLECYGRALASVCPGDVAPLRALVLDESVQVWTRIAVLQAWRLRVRLADAAQVELDDVLLTLGEHCASVLSRSADSDATGDGPDDVEVDTAHLLLPSIVREAGQLRSQRLQAVIYGWFDEELVDPQAMGRDDYDWYLHRPLLQAEEAAADRHEGLIHDPIEETRWWGCWSERGEASSPLPMTWPAGLPQIENPAPTTFVRTEQKVGRNDPCPCGSGKKYKKCHGAG